MKKRLFSFAFTLISFYFLSANLTFVYAQDPCYAPTNGACYSGNWKCSDTLCCITQDYCPNQTGTFTCTPNKKFCDGSRLKTCNAAGNGAIGPATDCSVNGNLCVSGGTNGASCQNIGGNGTGNSSGGSGGGGSVNLNQVIDNTLVPLGFKFNSSSTLGTILTGLLPILYGLAGVGLLIFLIVSGFAFLTSAGDPKKMEAAKGQITAAVLGFILIIAAFWITQIVNYIFGLGSGF